MLAAMTRMLLRLRVLFRRSHNQELEDELRLHLELLEQEYQHAGMSPEDARRAARRQFGNAARIQEQSRELFSFRLLNDLIRDAQLGVRAIRRRPGFAIVTIVALVIGIGANVLVFGVINSLLIRPLDVPAPARLVRAYSAGEDPRAPVDYLDYIEYRNRNQSFTGLAMFQSGGLWEVRRERQPAAMLHVMPVTGNYFNALGVRAAIGRTILPADDHPEVADVVVLSDVCWRRYYGSDPDVVGKIILIDRTPHRIIGVLPSSFKGADGATLIPMHYVPWKESFPRGHLIGRPKPGITVEDSQEDLAGIASQIEARTGRATSIVVYPARRLDPHFLATSKLAPIAVLFMAVVGAVLLVACGNIAILLLVQYAGRRREIAVRLALGASRRQLARQLVAENLVLTIAGGACGSAAAAVTARLLTQMQFPTSMPHALPFEFDWRVGGFAVALTGIALAASALGPAVQSLKTNVVSSMKEAESAHIGRRFRTGSRLFVLQVAMCTALLIVAALLLGSLDAPKRWNQGFEMDRVLMATVHLPGAGYTPEAGSALTMALLKRLAAAPAVVSATAVDNVPLAPSAPLVPVYRSGAPVYVNHVAPEYFRTLGIPLLAGRDFTLRDDGQSRVVGIVNETLARRFWPGADAVGQRLPSGDGSWIEIVGVARDAKYEWIEEEPKAVLYRPLAQEAPPAVTFLIKTSRDPNDVVASLHAEIARLDPNLLAYNVGALDERIGVNLLPNRAAAFVGGLLGLLSLILSAIGAYGTMAFHARQRLREIGIRIALGARPAGVVGLVTRDGLRSAAVGLALGISAAIAAARLIQGFLYGVPLFDAIAFSVAALLIGGTTSAACFIPAWRASRTDPVSVIRSE